MRKISFLTTMLLFASVCYAQVKIEIPFKANDVSENIITHTGYCLSFNKETNNPNWVAWALTSEETEGQIRRYDTFMEDPKAPFGHRVNTNDYKGSGYDRGHMCPAADMKWSRNAMRDCFYMTNICPQTRTLNAGAWNKLETACRRWAKNDGKVYIVCGPVYNNDRKVKTIGKDNLVRVPYGFFKVVLSLKEGKEKTIGFFFRNNDTKQTMAECACSVDDIEKMTGYNFFYLLNDKLENRIEMTYNLGKWN